MSHLSAPDGTNQPINNTTVQSFTIPAFAQTLLWGWSNAAWEQAVVIGIDGNLHPEQLGTFMRKDFIVIPEADHPRNLTLAGWHKRSGSDSSQPWHASRGTKNGDLASWDDSGGDNDFNDYRVRVAFIKSVIQPLIKFLPITTTDVTK